MSADLGFVHVKKYWSLILSNECLWVDLCACACGCLMSLSMCTCTCTCVHLRVHAFHVSRSDACGVENIRASGCLGWKCKCILCRFTCSPFQSFQTACPNGDKTPSEDGQSLREISGTIFLPMFNFVSRKTYSDPPGPRALLPHDV